MKIRTRILLQTLAASLALTVILGTVFFISIAGIRKTTLSSSNELGDVAAAISAKTLEVQLTDKMERIAGDVVLLLNEEIGKIQGPDNMTADIFDTVFLQIFDSAEIERIGQFFILDRDGTRIYFSDEDASVNRVNFIESLDPRLRSLGLSMTLGATGMTELEMNGLPFYIAYAPIELLGWSLGVAVSAQEVSAPAFLIEKEIWKTTDSINGEINRYILILAGVIALALFFATLGIAFSALHSTRAITDPILVLNEGVHEVASGNLNREVTIKTGDEIEQLAVSFNMMTTQLRKHIEEIAIATRERQRIDTELDVATQIQMSMLPDNFPPFRGKKNEFDLYATVHPAREVGGDFYDFFFIDEDHFAVITADVSGKGVPAALFMAISKTVIKNRLQSGESPALALEIINRQLCDNNIMDMFVTAWLCILEISSRRLTYVNAGHNPPLIKRGDQDFTFLVSPPDLVLAGMDDTRYHSRELQLKSGDMLFLYTDGIVEASDMEGAFYGKGRLNDFLNANAALSLRELLPRLRSDIAAFVGEAEQSDDITMLAIRINETVDAAQLYSINLKADIAELDSLIAFIDKGLDNGGCPPRIRSQIELAAEEIFVNIIRYAYSPSDDDGGTMPGNILSAGTISGIGETAVDCRIEPLPKGMTMTIVFRDKGRPFNPLEHDDPDITLPLEDREPGGLGLLIVKKTMDTIQYSREGETNRLEFSKSWQKETE